MSDFFKGFPQDSKLLGGTTGSLFILRLHYVNVATARRVLNKYLLKT